MPKSVNFQANERVDKTDLDAATSSFARDAIKLHRLQTILDNQSRILRGFRVELPDQNTYPGRITVHGGVAFDKDGQILFTEDQDKISRTVTLEGANTTFYIELSFTEADSDVDARAFWDPTVDQGTDPSGDERPDGQEFSNNIATRKNPDWKIVSPVSTASFQRDSIPTSTRIPLVKLKTDGSNKITSAVNPGLTTEKFATTLLQQVSTTKLRVVNPYLLPAIGSSLTVSEGMGTQETVTVSKIDYDAGLVTTSVMSNSHYPGAILRSASGSEPDLIVEAPYGRYRRMWLSNQIDYRDKIFQGDELHGEALSQGHGSITDRSDVNLQSLKQHVDFLAAQLQEMKWGIMDPYTSMTHADRTPPGVDGVSFPTTPRHFDRAGGIAPSRLATVTIGDGVDTFGDFNGTDETVFQAAHDALDPSFGGRIFVKKGIYNIGTSATFNITNDGVVTIEAEPGSVIIQSAGQYCMTVNSSSGYTHLVLKGLRFRRNTTELGILFTGTAVESLRMYDCMFENTRIYLDNELPMSWGTGDPKDRTTVKDCIFIANHANMASIPLIACSSTPGRMTGLWENCRFLHGTASALAGTVLATGSGYTQYLTFRSCEFNSTSASGNTDVVNLGGGSGLANSIIFEKCDFLSVNTAAHIRIGGAIGGNDLKIIKCRQIDAFAGFLGATNVDQILVDGLVHRVFYCGLGLEFTDCNKVKVLNCDLGINGILDLFQAAIIVRAQSADIEDYLISNNTIRGSTTALFDNGVGLMFDATTAHTMTNIRITHNSINECECGMAFRCSDLSAATYYDVLIDNNHIVDYGVSSSVANNMKLGIYGESNNDKFRWVISNNVIKNVNPATTVTYGFQGRFGIRIAGGTTRTNDNFTVVGNQIYNVGSAANPTGQFSGGISFDETRYSVIKGNIVSSVADTQVVGIMPGGSGSTFTSNVVLSDNYISAIIAVATDAWPIYFGSGYNVTITGNVINTYAEGGSGDASAIRWNNVTSGDCNWVTIADNVIFPNGNVDYGIEIRANTIDHLSITGNIIEQTPTTGVILKAGAGGTISYVTFANNTISCFISNFIPNGTPSPKANVNYVTITGNTLELVATPINWNVYLEDMNYVTMTGNTLKGVSTDSGVGRNLVIDNTSFAIIHSNIMKIGSGAKNIMFETGSTHWSIAANILDQGVGGTGLSIDETNSSHASGEAQAFCNLSDTGTTPGTPNVDGVTMTLNGQQTNLY